MAVGPPRAVAFFHRGLSFGGAERVVVEQVRALAPLGCAVDVWSVKESAALDLEAAIRDANAAVRDVGTLHGGGDVLWRLLRRRYDVVVTCSTPRAYRALARLRRIPFVPRPAVVETVHERYAWSLADVDGSRRRLVDLWLMTHDVSAELSRALGVPRERTAIARPLFPSILHEADDAARREARALRDRLSIPPNAIVVGYLGRLGANKGIDDLVRVVARLVRGGRDVHLILAGRVSPPDPLYAAHLDATLASATAADPGLSGRVHRLGPVAHSASTYLAFDVTALFSRSEGLLPLMLVESLSLGVPVVSTDVGGIATCLSDGVDAALVAKLPDDEGAPSAGVADAFVARVASLADDRSERIRLGAAGKARVEALVAATDFAGDTRRAIERAMALARSR